MAQSLVQAMPDLAWDHGGCNDLGMWMLQAGPGVEAVVLEDGYVVDPAVHTEQGVALLIDAENAGHLFVRQKSHATGVVGTIDNDFVKAEALNAPPNVLLAAGRLGLS